MKKRPLLPTGLLVFLSVLPLLSAQSVFPRNAQDYGQPDQPKFYAVQVIRKQVTTITRPANTYQSFPAVQWL